MRTSAPPHATSVPRLRVAFVIPHSHNPPGQQQWENAPLQTSTYHRMAEHHRPLHVVIVGGGMAGICAMSGLSAALNRRRLRRLCLTPCTAPCRGKHPHATSSPSPINLGLGFELSTTASGSATTINPMPYSSPSSPPLQPSPSPTSPWSSKATDISVNVTVIDPKDYLELAWANYRGLFDDHIASTSLISYDDILSSPLHNNVRPLHLKARVISLSIPPSSKHVVTDIGATLCYDVLIVATGAIPMEPVLNAVEPDMAMRARQLRTMGDRLMKAGSVLVVGGGPIGVEVAADVKSFAAMAGNEGCAVTLVQKGKSLVPDYGKAAAEMIMDRLQKMGVCVRLGCVAVPVGQRWRRGGKDRQRVVEEGEGQRKDEAEGEGKGEGGRGGTGKEKRENKEVRKYVIMATDDVSDVDIMFTSPQHGGKRNNATAIATATTDAPAAVENEHQNASHTQNGDNNNNDNENYSRQKQTPVTGDDSTTNKPTPNSNSTPTQTPTPTRTNTPTSPSAPSAAGDGDLIVPDITFLATGVTPSTSGLLTPTHTADGWLDVDTFGRLRGCDGSVFAYGDCTRSHPKSALKAMHNKARIGHNVLTVLDCICVGDAASMVRERELYAIVDPPGVAVVTTGPLSGVAKTPVGATSWILPKFKNRTMFVAHARSEIGLWRVIFIYLFSGVCVL